MPSNGNSLKTLAEKMKARTERERQELEELTEQQFETLKMNLTALSKNALTTTEGVILSQLANLEKQLKTRSQLMSRTFGRRLLQGSLLGLAMILGLSFGCWGLMRWETNSILTLKQEREQLRSHIIILERTASQLEAKTWGLELSETEKGRFIILPPQTTPETGWTVGTRQAIKLE